MPTNLYFNVKPDPFDLTNKFLSYKKKKALSKRTVFTCALKFICEGQGFPIDYNKRKSVTSNSTTVLPKSADTSFHLTCNKLCITLQNALKHSHIKVPYF